MTQPSQQQCKAVNAPEQNDEMMLKKRMQDIGFKLLVLSGKGGVGKSTVATNLAVSLAKKGRNVGLLDIDIHGPSIPKLIGLEGQQAFPNGEELVPIGASRNLRVMSIGFLLPKGGGPVIWRGPRKSGLIRQFLSGVAWGKLDYLVVDSPPGTGDEPMSIVQLVGSPAGAVIVTTPQDLAISDVRRCISFCKELSVPVVGIVENMSGYICPKCGEKTDLFKAGGGERLAIEMRVPFLGQVPIDPQVVISGDMGTPFIDKDTESPTNQAFESIVKQVLIADRENG